jgi:hypothetical protein
MRDYHETFDSLISLVSIVFLTDDIANRDLARQEGLIAHSCK